MCYKRRSSVYEKSIYVIKQKIAYFNYEKRDDFKYAC